MKQVMEYILSNFEKLSHYGELDDAFSNIFQVIFEEWEHREFSAPLVGDESIYRFLDYNSYKSIAKNEHVKVSDFVKLILWVHKDEPDQGRNSMILQLTETEVIKWWECETSVDCLVNISAFWGAILELPGKLHCKSIHAQAMEGIDSLHINCLEEGVDWENCPESDWTSILGVIRAQALQLLANTRFSAKQNTFIFETHWSKWPNTKSPFDYKMTWKQEYFLRGFVLMDDGVKLSKRVIKNLYRFAKKTYGDNKLVMKDFVNRAMKLWPDLKLC